MYELLAIKAEAKRRQSGDKAEAKRRQSGGKGLTFYLTLSINKHTLDKQRNDKIDL